MDTALSPSSHGSAATPIGVLITTYNRAETLLECLRHLERQTSKEFEVLVVVDGSSDATIAELENYRLTAAFPLRILVQPNLGAATARNVGAAQMQSPICLMLGDDIFAAPDCVRRHLEYHRTHPQQNTVALGLTRWATDGPAVTPLMRWLEDDGVQFAYGELLRGAAPTWKHFYTSNLSLKTSYLVENPFQENFHVYGMEDIELGYRLAKEKGLAISFLPDAVGSHLHPADYSQTVRRSETAGAAMFTFAEMWPEHRWHAPKSAVKRMILGLATSVAVLPTLTWVTGLLTQIRCPNPLLKTVLALHFRLGYSRAERNAVVRKIRDLQSEEACSVPGSRTQSGADKRD